ncbi:hypothetical protein [Candidatus Electronema sp. JC]|uniref:hypothetical protein n=1 Tax=Candidatus Electronema sp. JC TaxID=3401570 RepID=UPI003B42E650
MYSPSYTHFFYEFQEGFCEENQRRKRRVGQIKARSLWENGKKLLEFITDAIHQKQLPGTGGTVSSAADAPA